MNSLLRLWNRFWFEPQTTRALSCFRIAVGLLTIYAFTMLIPYAAVFFSEQGMLTSATLNTDPSRRYYSLLFWTGSPTGVVFALLLGIVTGLVFMCGYGMPWTSILLYVLLASFHERNPLVFSGAEHLLRNFLFFFMFTPRNQSLAASNRTRSSDDDCGNVGAAGLSYPPWAQRMMQIQVTVVYLCTAFAKLGNELWFEGVAMYYVFGLVDFNVRGVERLMNYPLLYATCTYVTLAAELTIPVFLWFRRTRPWAIGVGVALHAWITCFTTIPLFGPLMMCSYLLFLTENDCQRLSDRFHAWRYRAARANGPREVKCSPPVTSDARIS